jgi:transcriptional regulator with XRE-family HTH domain
MESKNDRAFQDLLEQIGSNVRRIRKEQGLSQMDLHYKSDVSRDWISDIENARKNASIQILFKLATALDIDIRDLFTSFTDKT